MVSSYYTSAIFAASGECVTIMMHLFCLLARSRNIPMMDSCVSPSRLPVGSPARITSGSNAGVLAMERLRKEALSLRLL